MPRKLSNESSKRSLSDRSKTAKNIINMISGNSNDAFVKQTAAIMKKCDKEQRKQIIAEIHHVSIPAETAAAMKATLNLPWNLMRNISRWLATFDIKLASEKTTRQVADKWIGKGLVAELAPLTRKFSSSNKQLVVDPKPWVYLYNVVGHILNRLTELSKNNQLVHHSFIPDDEIHVKIGGDHGDNSFKMSYQVANIRNPNRKENTTIFSIFEAKDSVTNLRICLERFKPQIRILQKQKWNNLKIRLFMYGDYEYLCAMYGISGANGRHCCLWCSIKTDQLCIPKFIRGSFPKRPCVLDIPLRTTRVKTACLDFCLYEPFNKPNSSTSKMRWFKDDKKTTIPFAWFLMKFLENIPCVCLIFKSCTLDCETRIEETWIDDFNTATFFEIHRFASAYYHHVLIKI
ncbi:uncharacterized protein LOC130613560 [Hydractinia symbiolongicarpus]|uniref:uncharacterized protein LOC130613560 n=1 Tax=Hydractinia symbiolongicarpus TaxID=13093 RepID=UPI002549D9EE|nr:uncharacterized protein LOC130613560 [Hydractinia symbiolongicarpus]